MRESGMVGLVGQEQRQATGAGARKAASDRAGAVQCDAMRCGGLAVLCWRGDARRRRDGRCSTLHDGCALTSERWSSEWWAVVMMKWELRAGSSADAGQGLREMLVWSGTAGWALRHWRWWVVRASAASCGDHHCSHSSLPSLGVRRAVRCDWQSIGSGVARGCFPSVVRLWAFDRADGDWRCRWRWRWRWISW